MRPDKEQKESCYSRCDFSAIDSFEWAEALVEKDLRRDYGESPYAAGNHLTAACTPLSSLRVVGTIASSACERPTERELRKWRRK